ncbi:MAG: hypothetical protein HF314_02330 [Ignavibacteria bacterium]|jgi:ketosteroid isomerase-like protein|nr:hypothetical protein [Ignavibacteria bacterium]MCU7501883.1 hypothetical protein [Ignavibacteria bacterium]MCU7514771.1 hypothetical protein [Ignavibacteria bacterium]
MKLLAAVLLSIIFPCGAFCQETLQKERDLLIRTDLEFSRLSEEKGSNEAFLTFASDSAVLLRKNSSPVEGRIAISQMLREHPDTSFTLSWKPMFSEVALSGELGYTYGIYEVRSRGGIKTIGEGTYVTIWKKDRQGNWKFVLDAGNEGLGPKK